MYIFNRKGEKIFETQDINEAWDGSYQGRYVVDGVYVWKIVLKLNIFFKILNRNIIFNRF